MFGDSTHKTSYFPEPAEFTVCFSQRSPVFLKSRSAWWSEAVLCQSQGIVLQVGKAAVSTHFRWSGWARARLTRAVGNGIHFCDTIERASQRLFSSYTGRFPCITEVGRNPLIQELELINMGSTLARKSNQTFRLPLKWCSQKG